MKANNKIYQIREREINFQKSLFALINKALKAAREASSQGAKLLKEAERGSLEEKKEAYILGLSYLDTEIKQKSSAASLALVYFGIESESPEKQEAFLREREAEGFCSFDLILAFISYINFKEAKAAREAQAQALAESEAQAAQARERNLI